LRNEKLFSTALTFMKRYFGKSMVAQGKNLETKRFLRENGNNLLLCKKHPDEVRNQHKKCWLTRYGTNE
jgi:hypothetical protein